MKTIYVTILLMLFSSTVLAKKQRKPNTEKSYSVELTNIEQTKLEIKSYE